MRNQIWRFSLLTTLLTCRGRASVRNKGEFYANRGSAIYAAQTLAQQAYLALQSLLIISRLLFDNKYRLSVSILSQNSSAYVHPSCHREHP